MSDSAPSPPPEDGSRATGESARVAMAGLAGPVGLVLVSGLAIGPHHGLLLPLLLGVTMVIVGERRLRLMGHVRATLERGAVGLRTRGILLATVVLSAAVLCTVLARGVAGLVVHVPAALWGGGATLLAALAWALVGGRLPMRARPIALLLLAMVIPWAGVTGTRYEAEGRDGRGLAHSGPILGIHPFQTTAIMVDGHGPFDLPINDYVEPDGSRGYGPEALADALDRALASIAERVYPDGPLRTRRAFLDAEVETVYTPAVWERLDREPNEPLQPRFIVRSGTFGRGSRVEFVCPGRRIDPRPGPQGESVMNKMCPDKYASEASAGLGVTGRWSGYSERRGNDRLGLFRWRGWTRTDDAEGRRVLERETRWWAWLVLVATGLTLLAPVRRVSDGLRGLGGAIGASAVIGLVVLCIPGLGALSTSWFPSGPSWSPGIALPVLAPALALGSLVLFAFEGSPSSSSRATETRGLALPAVLVVVASVALAASLPALEWALPLDSPREGLALPALVRGIAEAIGEPGGLTVFEVEGAVASALVALLLGALSATGRAVLAAAGRLIPPPGSAGVSAAIVVLALGAAAALVVSRKTAGAAALMPGVVGLTLVLGSGLLRVGGPTGRGWPGSLAHLVWTGLAVALIWQGAEALPSHPFVTVCTWAGIAAALAIGLLGLRGSPKPPPSPDA